jgi:hypothetical protein
MARNRRTGERIGEIDMDEFFAGFLDAAFWTTLDENEDVLHRRYNFSDVTATARDALYENCCEFVEEAQALLRRRYWRGNSSGCSLSEGAGHDFWLTRNRDGVGFWDGDWIEEVGEALTRLSYAYKSISLYAAQKRVHIEHLPARSYASK